MSPGLQLGCIHYVVKLIGQFCAVMKRVSYRIEVGAIIDDAKKAFIAFSWKKGAELRDV
jgi:hypothetical protein